MSQNPCSQPIPADDPRIGTEENPAWAGISRRTKAKVILAIAGVVAIGLALIAGMAIDPVRTWIVLPYLLATASAAVLFRKGIDGVDKYIKRLISGSS